MNSWSNVQGGERGFVGVGHARTDARCGAMLRGFRDATSGYWLIGINHAAEQRAQRVIHSGQFKGGTVTYPDRRAGVGAAPFTHNDSR